MDVTFHSDGVSFVLGNPDKVKTWLLNCISLYKKTCGDINVIFCDDEYLLSINNTYLNLPKTT